MQLLLLLLALAQAPELDLKPEPPGAAAKSPAGSAAAPATSTTTAPASPGAPSPGTSGTSGAPADKAGAPAETPDGQAAKPKPWYEDLLMSGALGLMIEGGIFMWPILILGIAALGVIIERYRSLRMMTTDTSKLRSEVLGLLQQDRVEEALARCNAEQGPVPAILSTGLRKYLVLKKLNYDPSKIEDHVVKSMDDYGVHIVAALEKHLPILATVASAAPMIGFLGTVQGMIISFDDILLRIGTENIVKLSAAGIKVALLTTCLGLIVGIPAYIAFNYFNGVINRFVLDVEEASAELIEAVTLQMALARGTVGEALDGQRQEAI